MKNFTLEANKLKDYITTYGNTDENYFHPQEDLRVNKKYSFIINRLVLNVNKDVILTITSLKLIDSIIKEFILLDLNLSSIVLDLDNKYFYDKLIEVLEIDSSELENKYVNKILIALANRFSKINIFSINS